MKNQKGITLIALVITIIVMLILVGVSVTVALNGGLFTTAKEAAEETGSKRNEELQLSEGKVTINGEEYNSIDEYVNGGNSNNPEEPTEPENPTDPSEPTEYTTYVVGDEVTVGGESFYVIANSDATQGTVTLLAKDCINTTTLLQSASADLPQFSNTSYWSSETEYPLDLNDYPIPEGVTSIITTVKTYGTKLGGTGRLMTQEEANALGTANSDILYGTNGKSSSESLEYWTSSAGSSMGVLVVYPGNGGGIAESGCTLGGFEGVRPVVEISKSKIS